MTQGRPGGATGGGGRGGSGPVEPPDPPTGTCGTRRAQAAEQQPGGGSAGATATQVTYGRKNNPSFDVPAPRAGRPPPLLPPFGEGGSLRPRPGVCLPPHHRSRPASHGIGPRQEAAQRRVVARKVEGRSSCRAPAAHDAAEQQAGGLAQPTRKRRRTQTETTKKKTHTSAPLSTYRRSVVVGRRCGREGARPARRHREATAATGPAEASPA